MPARAFLIPRGGSADEPLRHVQQVVLPGEEYAIDVFRPVLRCPVVVWKCRPPSQGVGVALAADRDVVAEQDATDNAVARRLTDCTVRGDCVLFLFQREEGRQRDVLLDCPLPMAVIALHRPPLLAPLLQAVQEASLAGGASQGHRG